MKGAREMEARQELVERLAALMPAMAALSARSVEAALRRIGERAGLARRVHPHILRHTFATEALRGGMDLTIIQRLLGHSDPKTTLIYAELRPERVRYEYERVIA